MQKETKAVYDVVVKELNKLDKIDSEIVSELETLSSRDIVKLSEARKSQAYAVQVIQTMFYAICTVEDISVILQGGLVESQYSWFEEKWNRKVLPESIYCNHELYKGDKKLQALMPDKKF